MPYHAPVISKFSDAQDQFLLSAKKKQTYGITGVTFHHKNMITGVVFHHMIQKNQLNTGIDQNRHALKRQDRSSVLLLSMTRSWI